MLQNNNITIQQLADVYGEEIFKDLLDAGVFYGRKKSRLNPAMKPYILGIRNNFAIINIKKTLESLEEAKNLLREKLKENSTLLLVGTSPAARNISKIAGNIPYVSNRWIGGLLTNFEVVYGRIKFFKKLKEDFQNGVFDKYTKKEKTKIQKNIEKLEELFNGLENLNELPSVLIVVDPVRHVIAVQEANKLKIPIVAFANTDANPRLLDIVVCGNTNSSLSVDWFLNKIIKFIEEEKLINSDSSLKEVVANNQFKENEQS